MCDWKTVIGENLYRWRSSPGVAGDMSSEYCVFHYTSNPDEEFVSFIDRNSHFRTHRLMAESHSQKLQIRQLCDVFTENTHEIPAFANRNYRFDKSNMKGFSVGDKPFFEAREKKIIHPPSPFYIPAGTRLDAIEFGVCYDPVMSGHYLIFPTKKMQMEVFVRRLSLLPKQASAGPVSDFQSPDSDTQDADVVWVHEDCCEYSLSISSVLQVLFGGLESMRSESGLSIEQKLLRWRVIELGFSAMHSIIVLGHSTKNLSPRERSALSLSVDFFHNNTNENLHSKSVQCFACEFREDLDV